MRIFTKATLRAFWEAHADAKSALQTWHRKAEHADWSAPVEVRGSFRHADTIGEFIVFDLCDGAYRLVVRADCAGRNLFIWDIYTHRDYDRIDFKAIDAAIRDGTYTVGS